MSMLYRLFQEPMKTVYNVLDSITSLVFVHTAPLNYADYSFDIESPKADVGVEVDNSPKEYVQQPYNLRPRKAMNYNGGLNS